MGLSIRYLLVGLAMMLAAVLAIILAPKPSDMKQHAKIELETQIPKSFGDWRLDTSIVPLQVDPSVQKKIDAIYNQTLARTYINSRGQRIMLSLAYGSNQSDSMRVHRPEVCYARNGFEITRKKLGYITLGKNTIPVTRLLARKEQRLEPITYWMVVGGKNTRTSFEHKLEQVKFGLTGTIPDGMLVRVSSIGPDADSYRLHEIFLRDLINSLNVEAKYMVRGLD